MLTDAAKNHTTTNAVVAMVMDVALALAMSFPMPRQAAHTTKPPRINIKVRITILSIGSTTKTAVWLDTSRWACSRVRLVARRLQAIDND
jgi:hypothetical protein